MPDANDKVGMYRVWDPNEETQSIAAGKDREDHRQQVKQIKLDNLKKMKYDPTTQGKSHHHNHQGQNRARSNSNVDSMTDRRANMQV